MFNCCKNIRFEKIFVSGLIYMAIAFVVHQIEALLTMKYYLMHEYFGLWSQIMMPSLGATPPARFFIASMLFSFITGVVLAAFYDFVKGLLADNRCQKIFEFSGIVIILSFVFFSLTSYLLFNVPFVLLVSWFLSSFVILLLSVAAFVRVLD